MRIVIAGAGLVGLSTAAALAQDGHDVTVVERADAVRAVGAGIGLWENGMAVLDAVGVGAGLRAAGHTIDTWFYDVQGNPVRAEGSSDEDNRFLLVPRPALSEQLADTVGADRIVLGEQVVGYREHGDGVDVEFASGRTQRADLLVAADGVHSRVRAQLAPGTDAVPHGGHVAWRAVVPAGRERAEGTVLTIGTHRTRGGYSRIGPDRTMWMVNQFDAGALEGSPRDRALARARNIVGDTWHRELLSMIEATPEEAVLENPVLLVPVLDTWVSERVVLVGDAAHGLSPHISAGGTLGLEDVGVLRTALGASRDLAASLRSYEDDRVRRFARVREFSAAVERADTAEEFARTQTEFAHWMTTTAPSAA